MFDRSRLRDGGKNMRLAEGKSLRIRSLEEKHIEAGGKKCVSHQRPQILYLPGRNRWRPVCSPHLHSVPVKFVSVGRLKKKAGKLSANRTEKYF